MKLSLKLTFELKRCSDESATQLDGTPRPGARRNTLPSYDTTTSPGGSEFGTNSSQLRKHASHGHRISRTVDKLSHNRSLRKIGNMLKFSEIQHPHHPELQGSPPPPWIVPMRAELPGQDVSEMSSQERPSELPVSHGNVASVSSTYVAYQEQPNFGYPQFQGMPTSVLNVESSPQSYDHHLGRSYVNTFTNQRHWPPQVLPVAHMSIETPSTSTWPHGTLSSSNFSQSDGHNGSSYHPSEATGAAASHSPSTATAASASPVAFAPSSHNNEVWGNGTEFDRHATISYPFSPPYGDQQHGADVYPSISPVSSHQSSHASGHLGPTRFPPTPPTASPPNRSMVFDPPGLQNHSFDGTPSSPGPQAHGLQRLSAIPSTTYDSTQFDTSSSRRGAVRPSQWERCFSHVQPPHESNAGALRMRDNSIASLDSLDDPLPLYDETHTPVHAVDHNATSLFEDALPRTASTQSPQNPALGSATKKVLPLLPCHLCEIKFTGEYQRGNLKRHMKRFHGVITFYKCRTCTKRYLRDDARKKHEWKKHNTKDCRPEYRCAEKKEKAKKRTVQKRKVPEGRIYMPNCQEEYEG
ncbi:hypothetical protein K458DRAFT_382828 [Lentithecium fluviatile CBS 122367]|uniref:C2H2-type domain-containing protein n=1 Tax=Lentithecium fluviatile CBS 122367 TaxID=1168545 RepID=A0A6G1JM06_9PLEO|nr:hypothetical protein K458DRAFT_382828 [Lentithecium fluviatile CBS 122367]